MTEAERLGQSQGKLLPNKVRSVVDNGFPVETIFTVDINDYVTNRQGPNRYPNSVDATAHKRPSDLNPNIIEYYIDIAGAFPAMGRVNYPDSLADQPNPDAKKREKLRTQIITDRIRVRQPSTITVFERERETAGV